MAKLNRPARRRISGGPIQASPTATGVTFEGAPGYGRDPQSALFLMGVSAFAGEGTFYESEEVRDARWRAAIEECMAIDPWWVAGFLKYLRTEAKMRTAAITGSAIGARWAAVNKLAGWARPTIDAVLQRADEPGEFIAFWRTIAGPSLPGGVQRGLADAVRRLYNERSFFKWDSDRAAYRFGDVIELVHPDPRDPAQSALFQWAIASRHGRSTVRNPNSLFDGGKDRPEWSGLPMHANRAELMAIPLAERRDWALDKRPHDLEARLRGAGMTWEALSGWAVGPMDRHMWEAVIPTMGVMALVRNLRNFDQAGVSDEMADRVSAKLLDPAEIAGSGILPFQIFSAYRFTTSERWKNVLRRAFESSVAAIPELPGRTLVLVDCSGSMNDRMSARSQLTRMEAAALFGTALAKRCEQADLVRYGNASVAVSFKKEHSTLRIALDHFPGMGGTETGKAIRERFAGHDRVVLLTDEQAFLDQTRWYGYGEQPVAFNKPELPEKVHFHVWNFAGYENAGSPPGPRHYWWGGLSDSLFPLMRQVERTGRASWPFEPLVPPATPPVGAVTRRP